MFSRVDESGIVPFFDPMGKLGMLFFDGHGNILIEKQPPPRTSTWCAFRSIRRMPFTFGCWCLLACEDMAKIMQKFYWESEMKLDWKIISPCFWEKKRMFMLSNEWVCLGETLPFEQGAHSWTLNCPLQGSDMVVLGAEPSGFSRCEASTYRPTEFSDALSGMVWYWPNVAIWLLWSQLDLKLDPLSFAKRLKNVKHLSPFETKYHFTLRNNPTLPYLIEYRGRHLSWIYRYWI